MSENLVAQGINYLRAMKQGNLNVYELAEELEIDIEHIKRCIKAARDRKEQGRKGFETTLERPKFYIAKGTKGEFQTVKEIHLEFLKSFTINFDVSAESEFVATLPVKVTVKRM